MRRFVIAAALVACTAATVSMPGADAQTFPKHLKNCKRHPSFEQIEGQYRVPDPAGGIGMVQLVSQNYACEHREKPWTEWPKFYGLKNAAGTLVIPYAYASLMPYATTGALVRTGDKYRTYTVGKGEGKEQYAFDDVRYLTPPLQCLGRADNGVSVPIGQNWTGSNRVTATSKITLFSPAGAPRVLVGMGGEGLDPAVQRVGDIFRARWRDESGAVRTGLLDLYGQSISPVLPTTYAWSTMLPLGQRPDGVANCSGELSWDLLLAGPSLDRDPSQPRYGPLLTLINRDGSPAALPAGAAGVIPLNRVETNIIRKGQRDNTTMWSVVFPTATGLEFTIHQGTPGEAIAVAGKAPRYSELSWTTNGWLMAKAASDSTWQLYRQFTDIPVGHADTDLEKAWRSGDGVIQAENSAQAAAVAAAVAAKEAERKEELKRNFAAAKTAGMMCHYTLDASYTQEDFGDYLAACGPDNYPTYRQLAAAKGFSEQQFADGASAQLKRQLDASRGRMEWEEQERLRRIRNANQDPGASYYPGQWESAIRNAGNAATDAINKSSDTWLQQRQDQYIADWQRSQRAY
ncbi:MAG: hypothetical protein EON93_00910 [Burkholderiales bacterium]|nr:MAG: hypothetical protein EON93_00910 [Burkholderiales bacterium]